MDVSLKSESSESIMPPSCDESPAAAESTASVSCAIAAHHVEQLKEPTPVLLCEWCWLTLCPVVTKTARCLRFYRRLKQLPFIDPISINSAVPVFRNQKVPHVVSREEARKGTAARAYPEAVSTSSEFTHRAIVHLIEAMHRCWDLYGSHERSRLFQNVQSELENLGHSLPVEKIRRKWNNLIVTYKRVKERSRLGRGQAKTSWEYFEMMDKVLGKAKINQSDPASSLVGFTATTKTAVRAEEHQMHNVSVAAMATPCLLPSGLFTTPSPIPTLVTSPLLCNTSPNPSPACSTDISMSNVSSKPASKITRQPLKRRFRHLQVGSVVSRFAQQQGLAGERTALLRNFITSHEERERLEEQRQRKKEARERRQERTLGSMAEAMGRMATALELISSKQDTIIALLQRLSDKH